MSADKVAAVALDDRKLPVFRKAFDEAGYAYEDGGAPFPGTTILRVKFKAEDLPALTRLIADCNARCGPPRRG